VAILELARAAGRPTIGFHQTRYASAEWVEPADELPDTLGILNVCVVGKPRQLNRCVYQLTQLLDTHQLVRAAAGEDDSTRCAYR
jgi:hypothetical protein